MNSKKIYFENHEIKKATNNVAFNNIE